MDGRRPYFWAIAILPFLLFSASGLLENTGRDTTIQAPTSPDVPTPGRHFGHAPLAVWGVLASRRGVRRKAAASDRSQAEVREDRAGHGPFLRVLDQLPAGEKPHPERSGVEADLYRGQMAQADKMCALGSLVGGIAHEINNPVGFIGLNVALLRGFWESALPVLESQAERDSEFTLGSLPFAEVRCAIPKMLSSIEEGAGRIGSLVTCLKEFARTQVEYAPEPIDLGRVADSAASLLASTLRKQGVRFEAKREPDLPAVLGSFQRLEQVVVDLLLNACQSIEERGRAIRVTVSTVLERRWVEVRVSDEGRGIAPEDLPRVTEPFFTTRRDLGAAGLGLAVSSRIAAEHGGTLTFESVPGQGTTAIVRIPAITPQSMS